MTYVVWVSAAVGVKVKRDACKERGERGGARSGEGQGEGQFNCLPAFEREAKGSKT